jgi:hypothetical protein
LNYPELLYYRDIVFIFKFMMTPTSAALPEIKAWMQNDADLRCVCTPPCWVSMRQSELMPILSNLTI